MLFQGQVPNTYAAARASCAVFKSHARSAEVAEPVDVRATARCECGRRRAPNKIACTRCAALEAARSATVADATVLAAFAPGETLSLGELVERFSYKHARHVLYLALRRLMRADQVTRRRDRYADGYTYTRVA